ncbi:MAG: hypothetical protein AMXMBFR83_18300 [Phycisphaerae bacterium]
MARCGLARAMMLWGPCGLLLLGALALRVRSHLHEQALFLPVAPAPEDASWANAGPDVREGMKPRARVPIRPPRDYVSEPAVAEGEERRGPRVIFSLAPNVTETLCALGLLDRLAGRTQFCSYPPAVGRVPVIGGLRDANLELIRAANPELVMTAANSEAVNQKLAALGIRGEPLPHGTLAEVFTAIERAGAVCDRPATARNLVTALRADLDSLSAAARQQGARPLRVLMVTGELPVPPRALWVAGPGLFLDELLRLAGHLNAAAEVITTPFGEIPLERLLVLDPDVILTFPGRPPTAEEQIAAYRSWWRVGDLKAIRRRRVRVIGGSEWLSATPRVAIALHRLITVLGEFQD